MTEEYEKKIEEMGDKIKNFGQILEKFGLNLIQSMGEMKHTLMVLNDKIEKIEKQLIDLKGLKTAIFEGDTTQRKILNKLEDIETILNTGWNTLNSPLALKNRVDATYSQDSIQFQQSPLDVVSFLEKKVSTITTPFELQKLLKEAKERLYVLTGGHKILLELRNYEREARTIRDVHSSGILDKLALDIEKWKKEL